MESLYDFHRQGKVAYFYKAKVKGKTRRNIDSDSGFGKGYIRLLVDEIRIKNNQAVMTDNYGALAQTVSTMNPKTSATSVPSFGRK